MKPVNILVVDDHPLVRSGLRLLIDGEQDLCVCAEAGSIAEALIELENSKPDLAIVDVSLPDGSGLDLIKRMHAHHPDLPVLVSSMHNDDLFSERVLRTGAKGYINKQEAAEKVIDAIRQVLQGKIYLSQDMTDRLLHNIADNSPIVRDSPIAHLSNREVEVFQLIGQGLGTSKIAEKLHLSIKTIETHRANIKKKLGLNSANELIRTAMQWSLEAQ